MLNKMVRIKLPKEWNFDSYKNNTVPDGFSYLQTRGTTGLWIIKSDLSAPSKPNVLVKLADNDTTFAYPHTANARWG